MALPALCAIGIGFWREASDEVRKRNGILCVDHGLEKAEVDYLIAPLVRWYCQEGTRECTGSGINSFTTSPIMDWAQIGHRCGPRALDIEHLSTSVEPHSLQDTSALGV